MRSCSTSAFIFALGSMSSSPRRQVATVCLLGFEATGSLAAFCDDSGLTLLLSSSSSEVLGVPGSRGFTCDKITVQVSAFLFIYVTCFSHVSRGTLHFHFRPGSVLTFGELCRTTHLPVLYQPGSVRNPATPHLSSARLFLVLASPARRSFGFGGVGFLSCLAGFLSRARRERSLSLRANIRNSSGEGSNALERKMEFGRISFIFLQTGPAQSDTLRVSNNRRQRK
jgi:hypothetical protein